MPVSFLDMQRRAQRIGRVRIGQQVKAANGGMRPATLTTFRFTTGSQVTAEAVAELYGGEARPWEGQRGQWEVITGKSEIWVNIPPADEVVSGWYEKWGASGIQRRCDSRTEQISGGPCLCPHAENPGDPDEAREAAIQRDQLAKRGEACARHLRINVQIPDLPGVGVFMLDTGSYNAATEVIGKAEMLEEARKRGIFLKAMLRIEWRQRGADRKPYPVPVLEILDTVRDIVSGRLEARGIRAQLPPAPGEPLRAIGPAGPAAIGAAPDVVAAVPEQAAETAGMGAQYYADLVPMTADRADVEAIVADAKRDGVLGVMVRADDGTPEQLRAYLVRKWQSFPPIATGDGAA